MRRLVVASVGLVLIATIAACGSSSSGGSQGAGGAASSGTSKAKVKIGIFEIESASVISQIVAGFKSGFFKASGLTPDQVTFDVKNAQGESQLFGTTAQYFASGSDDMIAVVGTPCVIALAHVEKSKPIIALAMGDPVGAGVAKSLNAPGENVTGSTDFVNPSLTLPQVLQLRPKPTRIGTIYDSSSSESQQWIAALKTAASSDGASISAVEVSGTAGVAAAVRSLVKKVDVLWIGPDATATAALPEISKVAAANKLPLLTASGDPTAAGVLANVGPSITTLSQLAGAAAAKVFKGTSPGSVAFGEASSISWTINSTTEKQIGISIPQSVLASATMVH
jgi:putative ABC transport system substrate-binding protein